LPTVTEKQLNDTIFADCLGTYSSRYNAGDVNRSYNVALASKNINELILAPGEVFSYNDSVGPRTTARGFRVAHVYVGNRVEDGVGGGICQVSSTLYNAVVLSDLKIVTRTNHSLPVSYVPMGRDATVSYGSIDFKFENNTKMPIKISASASGGLAQISIYGTKENPGRTVSIESVCTATYPAQLEQIEDPTLPEGTVQVEQAGSSGSSYQTYKIVSENGKVISREPLAKSRYIAANRIERVGTMPAAAPETDMPTAENPGETSAPIEPTESAAPVETTTPTAPPVEVSPITPTPAPVETSGSTIKPLNPAS
jgi:vancomycin resistance protein YoaR